MVFIKCRVFQLRLHSAAGKQNVWNIQEFYCCGEACEWFGFYRLLSSMVYSLRQLIICSLFTAYRI